MKTYRPNLILFILIFEMVILAASMSQAAVNANRTNISWGLVKTQTPRAWTITEGSAEVIVAVIDTGVDTQHPDLQNSLWINPGESGIDNKGRDKSKNGIDDDGNGYVDDIYGWNFAANKADVSDDHGHGTHISGLIAANGKSDHGVRGVAPHVKLMTLKYYDPIVNPNNNLDAIVAAIRYAIKMKARIINFSGGGVYPSLREEAAIREAQAQHILFVAAAGNEKTNTDIEGYFPADYHLTNILSVTALDPQGQVLPSSNFGAKTVDLAAPGENLLSTLPQGQWGVMSGTSQATALVSGVAALLMSYHPDWRDPEKIIKQIIRSGDKDPQLKGKTKFQSRLNSYQALSMSEDLF